MYRHKYTYRLIYFLIAVMPQIAAGLCGLAVIHSIADKWQGETAFNHGYTIVLAIILIRTAAITYLDRTGKFKKLNIAPNVFRDDTHAIVIYAFIIGLMLGSFSQFFR